LAAYLSYSETALAFATSNIDLLDERNFCKELAINFYYPHYKATSDIKFPKFSNENVLFLPYSLVDPVKLYPKPAKVFNILGVSPSDNIVPILYNIGKVFNNSLPT
jgi:hypothetical protein